MTVLDLRDNSIITQVAAKLAGDVLARSVSPDAPDASVAWAQEEFPKLLASFTSDIKAEVLKQVGSDNGASIAAAIHSQFPGTRAEEAIVQSQERRGTPYPAAIPGVQDGDPETAALWQEYFRDPAKFWDNRNGKRNPKAPDFKHKDNPDKVLWIVGKKNPSWVAARLDAF